MLDYPWWNEAQRELLADAEKFTAEVLAPIAEKCAYKRQYPWEALRKMAQKGWFGATVPKKYGGHQEEWGVTGAAILCEETSRVGAASISLVTTLIGATTQILHDGNEEQKQKWLPQLAAGELTGCIVMTEPYAGSDIADIQTTAVLEGDHYVVNGKKRFQTSAGAADLYMTYVRTGADPDARRKYKHLTGMIIEKGMPGFSVERVNELTGYPGVYNCYLSFDDLKVPVDNVIGGEGNGWNVMMRGLNVERILSAAGYLGGIREAIRYAKQHLERRVQFNQTTGSIATNQFKLADMYADYQLSRLLVFYGAYAADMGRDIPLEAALAKLYSSDSAFRVSAEAIQCMGGNGVMQIYPVEKILRDAKLNQIAAGTNEIQRLLIYRMGNSLLGEYLKPPVRVMDEELNLPVPVGKIPPPKPVNDENDVLKTLAENYRVNPGLHMTIADMRELLDVSEEDLLKFLDILEEKELASLLRNKRGKVEMAAATLTGIKEAFPLDHYRYTPAWADKKDLF